MSMFRICFFLLLIIAYPGEAQHRVVVKNLSDQFKLFHEGGYLAADSISQKKTTLYLSIDTEEYKGNSIELESKQPVMLFINGKLARPLPAGISIFNLDSLSALYSSRIMFALHDQHKLKLYCAARVIALLPVAGSDYDLGVRNPGHFHNFSILACGMLMICFVLLFRVNPQLLFDYLNFIKLISVQEREENMLSTKIVASSNLLFYGVASMFLSFLLMVMSYYSHSFHGLLQIEGHQNVGQLLLTWLNVSIIVFGILMLKYLIVFSFSRLFAFGEAPTIQFFSFVRLVFMIGLLIGLLLVIYFAFGVLKSQPYVRLFYIMSIMLAFWIPVVFLKLLKRSSYSIFHLFSYLCATEIFPIVIVVKLLFL